MQGYRIFAYVTMILVVALLVLVTTQGLFVFIQPGDPSGWLVLVLFAAIYFSVAYGLSRRFARKPMRPPTIPLVTGVLLVIPPVVLNLLIEHEVLVGALYWAYLLACTTGAMIGSWYGMNAGWRTLIETVVAQRKSETE